MFYLAMTSMMFVFDTEMHPTNNAKRSLSEEQVCGLVLVYYIVFIHMISHLVRRGEYIKLRNPGGLV